MKKTLLYIIFLIVGFGSHTYAQSKINVITKTIKKEFMDANQTLIVKSEKSNITIHKWEGEKLKVQIDLIARNTSKSKAEKDLKILQYSISETDTEIKLSNFFKSDRVVDITSNLSVVYKIYIPTACTVDIKNLYGKISINNIQIYGEIDNTFGSVSLQDVSGNLNIDLYYSDLTSNNTSGELNITSKNSNISMEKLSGNNSIQTNYGKINIESARDLKSLVISSQRTTVDITVDSFENYTYELEAYKEKIVLPVKYVKNTSKESASYKFKQSYNTTNKTINIKTTFCPITIKTN